MTKPAGMRVYLGQGHPKYIGSKNKRYYNGVTKKIYTWKGYWVEE